MGVSRERIIRVGSRGATGGEGRLLRGLLPSSWSVMYGPCGTLSGCPEASSTPILMLAFAIAFSISRPTPAGDEEACDLIGPGNERGGDPHEKRRLRRRPPLTSAASFARLPWRADCMAID
jgi:hypothetical protein